ncbi:hypothetical protein, partial [Ralstonia soli]
QHHPAQEGETHRQTTRTKRHLTAFGVGQFSMQILGQNSVQINSLATLRLELGGGSSLYPSLRR